jgi:hypothetical protein
LGENGGLEDATLLDLGLAFDVQLRLTGGLVHTQHLRLLLALAATWEGTHDRTEEAAQHYSNKKAHERRPLHAKELNGMASKKSRNLTAIIVVIAAL